MRRNLLGGFTVLAVLVVLVVAVVPVLASPPVNGYRPGDSPKIDDRMDPLTSEQRALRRKALEAQLTGKAKGIGKGKSLEVAKGQYVELEREGEDPVWTVLGEFSDFSHNSIAEPIIWCCWPRTALAIRT